MIWWRTTACAIHYYYAGVITRCILVGRPACIWNVRKHVEDVDDHLDNVGPLVGVQEATPLLVKSLQSVGQDCIDSIPKIVYLERRMLHGLVGKAMSAGTCQCRCCR